MLGCRKTEIVEVMSFGKANARRRADKRNPSAATDYRLARLLRLIARALRTRALANAIFRILMERVILPTASSPPICFRFTRIVKDSSATSSAEAEPRLSAGRFSVPVLLDRRAARESRDQASIVSATPFSRTTN